MTVSDEPFKFDHRFTFIWHTTWARPCEICGALNGRTWTDQSLYQHTLWDPFYGDLWDLDNDFPLTHPNCKCVLEVQYTSTLEELLKPELSEFEEWNLTSSNIQQMKAEMADFERSLEGVQKRAQDTVIDLTTVTLFLRRLNLPPELDRALMVFVRGRASVIKFIQAVEMLELLSAASSLNPLGLLSVGAMFGISILGASSAAMDLTGQ